MQFRRVDLVSIGPPQSKVMTKSHFLVAVVMVMANIRCGVGQGDGKVVSYYVIIIEI